jgi:hypothetical protein
MLLLVTSLVAYLVLAAMFTLAAAGTNRRARWLGLAALAAAAPSFIWMGAFGEKFDSGQCYSSVINVIANAVKETDDPKSLAEKIRALPMSGYETRCSEVEAAAHELPKRKAP